MFKKIICVLTAVLMSVVTVSCNGSTNVYDNEDFYTEDGRITVSARFAYYNNGKKIEELKDFDSERYKEAPTDDGSFTIYFAVSNNTDYDKKITDINVEYIKNSKEYNIVEPADFSMDEDFYLVAGETQFIECNFEKAFVKMVATLDTLTTKASISYEGCVVNGAEPEDNGGISYSVKEAKFTSTNGLNGSFCIKNFSKNAVDIGELSFMLYTDKGIAVTKNPIKMTLDLTLNPSESSTYNFGVLADNINDDIKESKLFNTIVLKAED